MNIGRWQDLTLNIEFEFIDAVLKWMDSDAYCIKQTDFIAEMKQTNDKYYDIALLEFRRKIKHELNKTKWYVVFLNCIVEQIQEVGSETVIDLIASDKKFNKLLKSAPNYDDEECALYLLTEICAKTNVYEQAIEGIDIILGTSL